ncbi:MAG: cupin domain-containing protein [Actinomycetota bacterium]|nr:cupin domain-containing protein [Actinomycetota bacterium]
MTDGVRNLTTVFDTFAQAWQPHLLARVNDHDLKVAWLDGEFVWHTHPESDELFLVVGGRVTIALRDRDVELGPHDVFVVPRGVEHCPRTDEPARVLMIEMQGTTNTGDAGGDRTAAVRELA